MAPKVKTSHDCRNGHDYAKFLKGKGVDVVDKGPYYEARVDDNYVRFPSGNQGCQDLPKDARMIFVSWMTAAGLIILPMLCGFVNYASKHPGLVLVLPAGLLFAGAIT